MKTCIQERGAFTLIELLAVMVIGALLIAICIPVLSKMKGQSDATKCIANQQSIGQALFAYAADHDGKTVTAYEPDFTRWPDILFNQGYLSGGRKVLACPTYAPYKYSPTGYSSLAYGLRRISSPWENRFDGAYTVGRVPKPSSYILLADSVEPQNKRQFYYLDYPGYAHKPNQIHLRHFGNANILFGDGSVRALDKKGIQDLGDGWNDNAICEGNP